MEGIHRFHDGPRLRHDQAYRKLLLDAGILTDSRSFVTFSFKLYLWSIASPSKTGQKGFTVSDFGLTLNWFDVESEVAEWSVTAKYGKSHSKSWDLSVLVQKESWFVDVKELNPLQTLHRNFTTKHSSVQLLKVLLTSKRYFTEITRAEFVTFGSCM